MDANHRSPVKDQLVETVLFDFPAEARKRTMAVGDLRRDHNLRDDNDRLGWGRRQAQNGGSPDGDRWFESISLQRTVRLTPAATFERQEPGLSPQVCEARLTTGSAETQQAFYCAPTGGNVSAGPYSSTEVPLMRSAAMPDGPNEITSFRALAWVVFEFGSGSSKAEQGPLVVPGKRQT